MTRKGQPIGTVQLRVLGYVENGAWVAHCLETDLVGIGSSFDAALKELKQATGAQLSFALFMKQPSLFSHSAPLHIIETYNRLHAEHLERLNAPVPNSSRAISAFSLPAATRGNFLTCEAV